MRTEHPERPTGRQPLRLTTLGLLSPLLLTLALAAASGCGGDDSADAPDAAVPDGGGAVEECGGHGHLHGDPQADPHGAHCHCDPGFRPSDDNPLVCVSAGGGGHAGGHGGHGGEGGGHGGEGGGHGGEGGGHPDEPIALSFEPQTASALHDLDDAGRSLWVYEAIDRTPRVLRLENYTMFGGPGEPGIHPLTETEADYADCGVCLLLQTECDLHDNHAHCQAIFMPEPGGQVELTELGVDSNARLSGVLTDITFREVTIDRDTLQTRPVPNGRRFHLARHAFDLPIRAVNTEPDCGGHGQRHGNHCHCDPGYRPDPSDPLICVPA